MIDWKVGDKVVCFEEFNFSGYGFEVFPIVGETYTIRSLSLDEDGDIFILVDEIVNPYFDEYIDGPGEIEFFSRKFRKLIDKKKTTEFFEKLCLDATKKMELVG